MMSFGPLAKCESHLLDSKRNNQSKKCCFFFKYLYWQIYILFLKGGLNYFLRGSAALQMRTLLLFPHANPFPGTVFGPELFWTSSEVAHTQKTPLFQNCDDWLRELKLKRLFEDFTQTQTQTSLRLHLDSYAESRCRWCLFILNQSKIVGLVEPGLCRGSFTEAVVWNGLI